MRDETALIGRDDELARLEALRGDSGRSALLLRGDAGVGKSALLDVAVERAGIDGWKVLRAAGVEAEQEFALGGLNQMVFSLRDQSADLSAQDRELLAPVFGADPVHQPAPIPLAVAVLNLLAVAAHARPLLLVVDDLQWLDAVSATVLSVAGRRLSHNGVRLLAACRPHTGPAFSSAGWTELPLGPLGAADAARLVDQTPLPLSAATRHAILEAAAGNPLALQELPHCADQIDTWAAAVPLTDRLVSVFGGRLRQLDAAVRTELLRAALDGANVTVGGSRYVMQGVDSALEQGLVVVDAWGNTAFRHPLVRAAVIHQASAQERREAHAHLATCYQDVPIRHATHLSAATTAPDQTVADLLDRAARLSIRRGGAAVAVDWLRRAAELSTQPTRRTTLLADAAFVAAQSSRFDDAQALLDTTEDAATESVPAVLTGAYLALYRDGEVTGAHRRVLAALRRSEDVDEETLARLVKLALAITLYAGDAHSWEQTDDVIDRLGARVDARALIYRDAWGDVVRRGHTVRARLLEQLDLLGELDPWEVMRLAVAAYYVDGLAEFGATVQRMYERERDRGAVTTAMTMSHLLMLDQLAAGRWADAEQTGQDGLELTRVHRNELFEYQCTAYLGVLAACRGDVEQAREHAGAVIGWSGPRRLGLHLGFAQRAVVLAALAEADYEAAYTAAVRIAEPGEFPACQHQAAEAMLDLVEAAVHTGRDEQARRHAEAAAGLGLGEVSARLGALTTAVLAMTEPDADLAGELFASAAANPAIALFPFEHARIRLAHGAWLRRQRRQTQAREELALAADVFDQLGARPWAQRARTELRAAGASVKRAPGEIAPLSAQERRIAELAAAGHSNKEIAAQLYLSPRTVGAHLYRLFPKLGVTSRAALGDVLRRIED